MNRMRRVAWTAFLFASLALVPPAHAAGRADCLSVPSKILGRPVAYCVLLPPSYDAEKTRHYPILYLLHGLGDNEQMLIHSGGMNLVEDLWEQHEIAEFLIVTPAAGASFYINSRDGRQRYGNSFLREFLPVMERRYRVQPGRGFRGIAGISMGGYGALHLAFRHPELFASVGAHSAALIENLPVVNSTNGRQLARLRVLGGTFGSPFDFGFDAGAEELDKMLTSRHIPHEFHLYPGSHNWSYFAEHLPALLQFHSRAFGSALSPRSSSR